MTDLTGQPTFDEFWSIYPKRVGKAEARKSWDKAVTKIKIDPKDIIDGAKRYAAAKRGTDVQYVAHASTWLNQQRWADEEATISAGDVPTYKPDPEVRKLVTDTELAQDLKKRILRATRLAHTDALHEAARRLNTSEAELWSCMEAGFAGFEARAWKHAVAFVLRAEPHPEFLNITREHWFDGKERLESRARAMAIKKQWRTPTIDIGV